MILPYRLEIVLAFLIVYTSSLNANTYYVSKIGNDKNDGSFSSPWRTVKYAWRNSGGGDTVLVRQGTYTGYEIWLHKNTQGSGIENQFWILKAYTAEVPIFENCRIIIDDSYVRIQGFHFSGTSFLQSTSSSGMQENIEILDNNISSSPKVPIYFMGNYGRIEGNNIHVSSAVIHGIYVMHGDGNIIRNNYITGMSKYGIHIYDENKYNHKTRITNLLVENNIVEGSKSRSGIIVSAGESTKKSIEIENVTIRNNIVINNAEDGITIRYYGRVRNIDIYNNTIVYNGSDGLRISADDVDDINVKNNTFSFNRVHLNISSRIDNYVISHNLFWHPASVGLGVADTHAVFDEPLFVDIEKRNFHPRKNSPAIDAGVDVGIPYYGISPDLGAFEFDPSSSSTEKFTR
jgi:hypothetical protein